MAKFNFSGSIENVSDGSLRFINKVITEQDIKVKNVTFKPVGNPGDNLAANVKRIIVEGEDRSLHLIVKIAPQNEGIRQFWHIDIVFVKEHIMYTEFFPKLEQMQIEAAVPKTDRFRYAKCYGSMTENLQETIILEDLKYSGFVMLDKLESLNDTCVRSILKNLAILHAFSYVLKSREPEIFDGFKSRLLDTRRITNSEIQPELYVDSIVSTISLLLDDQSVISKIKNKLTNVITELNSVLGLEYHNKSSVILQGDAWTNNFMFRFKDNQPIESIMLDYQLSINGNPVNDVMNMIFNCTDYETRSKHYSDWIDYYHTELDKSLSYYNLSASTVYPRNEMEADMKRYANYVFSLSCIVSIVTMRTGDEAGLMFDAIQNVNEYSDLVDTMMTENLQGKTRATLKEKINGIVKSFETFGIFDN